ncbi:MAG: polysaccharide biosynthesis/export family protein [Caulobacteraceae bacterium]
MIRRSVSALAAPPAALCLALFCALWAGPCGAAPALSAAPAPVASSANGADYRIGPLDKLDITVFEVKDLSIDKLEVDASGRILLPLIGSLVAEGKTTSELSAEIAARLAKSYLQDPQVSVVVEEAAGQKVSVEGAVNEAGVFDLKGRTSLLEAVAMAKGTSKYANLHKVSIIRRIDGAERAATFDLSAIGSGKAPDPEVVGNDVVIVADSHAKDLWRGMVEALPAFIIFTYL